MRCVVVTSSYYSDRERILREFSAKAHFTGAKENESARPNSPKTRVVIADTHQPIRTAAAGIRSAGWSVACIDCARIVTPSKRRWLSLYQIKLLAGRDFIALATLSFQAIRAAIANPAKSLRTE